MVKTGSEYNEVGQGYYEKQYRDRMIKNLNIRAKSLGLSLVENTY